MKLVIVGLDPGTTIAYAVLGLDGELLSFASAKQKSMEWVISEVFKLGSPVAVACDKRNPPSFVKKFSTTTGAMLITPKGDLRVKEKRGLIGPIKTHNLHELDALASAFFAYKKIKPLIIKLKKATSHIDSPDIKEKAFRKILRRQGISIREELRGLLSREQPEIIRAKRISATRASPLKHAKKDINMLKQRNKSLKNQISLLTKQLHRELRNRIRKADALIKKHLSEKMDQIKRLKEQVALLQISLKNAENAIHKAKRFWTYLDTNRLLLKLLPDLKWETYKKWMLELGIKPGDVLFVADPNSYSKKTIESIENSLGGIVYINPPGKSLKETKIVFVNVEDVREGMVQWAEFAIVDRRKFETAMVKAGALNKIIEDYKRIRKSS